MGLVAITFKIMPESADSDIDKIKHGVEKCVLKHHGMELKSLKEVPIAFGLKALELLITMQDKTHGTDALEEALGKIDGVASVESGDVTLI